MVLNRHGFDLTNGLSVSLDRLCRFCRKLVPENMGTLLIRRTMLWCGQLGAKAKWTWWLLSILVCVIRRFSIV